MDLERFEINQDAQCKLLKYTQGNTPHMIFAGSAGVGKLATARNFIERLANAQMNFSLETFQLQTPSKSVEVQYNSSGVVVEINPSSYKQLDSLIIQTIIKNVTQVAPISGLLGNSMHKLKYIIILEGCRLSKEAQAALRRTMEKYSSGFRLVILCNELGSLIEPLRSRSLIIRIEGLCLNRMLSLLMCANDEKGLNVSANVVESIANRSIGNSKRAISELYMSSLVSEIDGFKLSNCGYIFEWLEQISRIVSLMYKGACMDAFTEIRKILYLLLGTCVPPAVLIEEIFKSIYYQVEYTISDQISLLCLKYDERLLLGSKPIIHLEAFIFQTAHLIQHAKNSISFGS